MDRTLIIAEAGVNHNGSLEMAKTLVDIAKDCGADYVKFQTAKVDSLVSKYADMAKYQKENTGKNESQKEMLKKLLLSFDDFMKLADYCKDKKITFISTPFDIDSIHFLNDLVPLWKIPSGEVTNLPYLIEIAKTHKKVILSTGMCTIEEVEDAVNILYKYGTKDITLLHCTTQYPTPVEAVNLKAMLELKKKFNVEVGYSDHTAGIEVPIAAAAMGAKVIEKHFTISKLLKGPDHKASLEPEELKNMILAIRNIEKAMGSGEKMPVKEEKENICIVRKSIVASRDIKKGEVFSDDNITTKRPGSGISPMKWFDVIGTCAIRNFEEDELIEI